MPLRERLAGEQAALQAQRLEAEQQEREKALAPVKSRIAQIEAAQKDLTELRSQIGTDLESFLTSVKTFKGKSDQIDKLRKEFSDVLAEKEITSKGQFVEGEEFQEEQEVQEYKGAKGETGSKATKMREVVGKVKESIPDLTAKTSAKAKNRWEKNSPQVWKERVSAVIEDKIKELDIELADLKLKTPEGQAERQQQYREQLKEKIKRPNFASPEDFKQLDQMRLVDSKDWEMSKVIGEDSTKRILGEVYTAKAEADFDKVKQAPERADVRRLNEYHDKLRPIQAAIRDVELQRGMTKSTLEHFYKTDEGLRDRLSRYGSGDMDRYFKHLEDLAIGSDMRWETITEELKRAESVASTIDNGRSTQGLFKTEHGSYGETAPTRIPDLEDLLRQAKRYLEFYANLAKQLKPENFPMKDEARKGLVPAGDRGFDRRINTLNVDSKLQKELSQRSFAEIRDRVSKQDEEDEKRRQKLVALIPEKVSADWAELKQRNFENDDRETARLAGDVGRQKKQTEVILKALLELRGQFRNPDLKVQIKQNESRSSWDQSYYVDSVDYEPKRNDIANQLDSSRKELETLQRNIRDKRAEINKAWRKGKLEKELTDLEEQVKPLQDKIDRLQNDSRKAHADLYEPVSGLGKVLGSIKLEKDMVGQTMTVKELLDRLGKLDGSLPDLTSEQQQKLVEYNALKQAAEEARKRYAAVKQSK